MDALDDVKKISQLDSSDMIRVISGLPEQCRDAYKIGKESSVKKLKSKAENMVFAGIGGSAIGADIVRIYLQNELNVPVIVCRNYTLPAFVGKNTLLFCSSYSGNTEETLSAFEGGLKKGAQIITLGSGGKLRELSLRNGFVHIDIPKDFPPRTAVGHMSIAVIAVLVKLGLVKDRANEVDELYSILKALRDREVSAEVSFEKNISKQIASKLYNRYCIIYGTSDATEAVSIRWRGQIAENSKALASSHVLPEMNHNEIVGWEFPKELLKDFKVIMLRDRDDYTRTKKRIDISKKIIEQSGAEVIELERKGKEGILARLFSLIYIGDFASFYLAILNGIDPTPVKKVDYLKSELAKVN